MDNLQKKIDELKSPEFIQKKMIEKIIEKVPEAQSEIHKFHFTQLPNGNLELKSEGISPELYSKIMKAFGR